MDWQSLKSRPPEGIDRDSTVLLVEGLGPSEILDLVASRGFTTVIQEDPSKKQKRVEVSAKLIAAPERFVSNPLEYILAAKPTVAFVVEFDDSKKKDETLKSIREFVLRSPGTQTVVDSLVRIADELYTNAVFNAPKSQQTRSQQIKSRMAKIEVGISEGWLAIACTDFFGSLEPQALVQRILDCEREGLSSAIRMDTPGAGIGAHFIFDAASSFFAYTKVDHWTVVGCLLPLSLGHKQTQQKAKSIHIARISTGEVSQNMGQIKVENNDPSGLIKLSGDLDEDAVMSQIQVNPGVLNKIDLGDVTSINSCGIREWVKWKKALPEGTVFEVQRCPKLVVDQINMLDGFLPSGSKVSSFFVPYYCEGCELVQNRLFSRGTEYDGKKVHLPSPPICTQCAKPTEIDVIEAKYFKFLNGLG